MPAQILTGEQQRLVDAFVENYNIEPSQISFEKDKIEPILDFEALSVVVTSLAEFKSLDASEVVYDQNEGEAKAFCAIVLPNDRTIRMSNYAILGEPLPDGTTIDSRRQCESIARARAVRTAIRAAGFNILRAHREFLHGDLRTLSVVTADPRENLRKEVQALAHEVGLKSGKERADWEEYLGANFGGRTSSSDLSDDEMCRLAVSLRAVKRVQTARLNALPVENEKLAA